MIRKSCLFITAAMLISMITFSQTIKDNIEKLSKDPKTTENASKADVYIINNKKAIGDTTAGRPPKNTERVMKISRKKKQCRKS